MGLRESMGLRQRAEGDLAVAPSEAPAARLATEAVEYAPRARARSEGGTTHRVSQLEILITRSERRSAADFNTALLRGLGETAKSDGVSSVVVHLIDAQAAAVDPGRLARSASFDAVIGVGLAHVIAEDEAEQAAREAILELARDLGICHAYSVEPRVMKAHAELAPGARTPGIVMVSTLHRAARLTALAFDAHWSERHAPLALEHHVGMWDYRQLAVREVLSRGSPPWAGIALMGFPTVEDFRTGLFDSDAGMQIILADTARFLALDRGETAMMSEYWIRT